MKHIYAKLATVFGLLVSLGLSEGNAQCNNTIPYSSASVGGTIFCQYAGEYGTWNGLNAGTVYRVTSTVTTDFMTIRSGSPGGTVVAMGVGAVSFTAPTTTTYYIHVSTNCLCGTANACRDITLLASSACNMFSAYGSGNAPTTSTPVTLASCAYAGEYATMSSTAAFTGYTATSTVTSDYLTIRQGTPSGPVVAAGNTPLNWYSTAAGTYYVHTASNSSCGTNTSCRNITMALNSCTPPPPPVAPANDLCSNAQALSIPSTTSGTTVNATVESPAPPTCSTTYSQPGVWYTVVGNGNRLGADLCATSWDSKIFVYTGTCGAWTCVTGNDDVGPLCSSASASVQWCSQPGVTYRILVTGYSSASAFTLTISQTTVPTPSASATPASVCAGQPVTLTGSGSSTYNWNPGNLNGASVTVNPTTTTTYTVTGTDAATGCSKTATTSVVVNPAPTITAAATNASFCVGGSTTLNATGGTSYVWNPGNLSGSSVTVSPTTSTTYTVTGTGANGCTGTSTVAVTVNPLPTVTAAAANTAICIGGSTTLTGGGASTYVWNPGNLSGSNVTVTPTSSTTYTVTGTNANGCVNTATIAVTVNSLPTVTASAAAGTICIGATETLTAGGASTYAWSSGGNGSTETVSPTTNTTYTVTGTDANGCANTATVSVNVNPLPTVTATAAAGVICDGATETLTAGGASTYAWSSGGTAATETVTPNTTTTYTVTGTDANGCVNTATVTVNVNALPAVTASAMMATICDGGSDTLMASGADTYAWSSGGTAATETVAPNTTTTYTVTGTDVNGCVNTATVTVNVNALPTVSLGSDVSQCEGTVILDAQNSGAMFMWNDSTTAQTLTVAASGTYSVMVTDTNGCMNSDTINVTINSNPTVALGADSTQCGGTVTLDAQNQGSSFVWSDNSTSQTLVASTSGTYYVAVTDANGCVGTDTVNVTINTLPTVTGTASASTVCVDDADVTLTGAPAGGAWSGPGVTGANFDPSVGAGAQTLTYNFTDANGCSGSATVTVTVDACVGVAENTLAEGVNVYPNPNNGVFTLAINANVGDVIIEMVDMQGRVVYAANENNVQTGFTKQISLETQASGLYIIRVTSANEQHTLRVNVQK